MQRQVAEAEAAFAEHDARKAITAAQAASESLQALNTLLETYGAIRDGIVRGRHEAESLAAEGYRMEASQAALDGARAALTNAANMLQTQGIEAAGTTIQAALVMLEESVANGRGLVELRAANEQRLEEIKTLGEEAAAAIVAGRQTFDIVDEFAESTWSDIRGNGSEAEAAADRAHEHWLNARQHNSMESQEFVVAQEELDTAVEELAYTRALIDTITQRLEDLEAARDAARDEISAAAADITRGWEFVRSNDPDVGKAPEAQLRQAEELLSHAQTEMQREKPDWLVLVRDAQAANDLADQALLGARSEVEAMEKLRAQVERARQLAAAEVKKIVQFSSLHRQDIQPTSQPAIAQIQQQVQQAYTLLQQSEQLEEERRREALQRTYASYTQLQTEAARVYAMIYADFQRLEKLRGEVNQELARARDAIGDAERLLATYRGHVPSRSGPVQRIRAARRSFDQIKLPITGERDLENAIQLARNLQREARDAADELRRNYRPPHDHGSGEMIAGMLIGAALDSAMRSGRRGGWGGSGSWSGGGGGGWGSLGGGGGSWGGGGGGGGSWGGGGGGGGW
ncbi:MAG: hypothetical protein MI924_36065 [Chloroflexales bacterium]|nr:hypothetical protein [Chloroflexales bacterium]